MSLPLARKPSPLPSVDEVLRGEIGQVAVARFGRRATVEQVRAVLDHLRAALRTTGAVPAPSATVAAKALERLEADDALRLRRVFNLTGTVLHTNLGRALLPEAAIEAAVRAMRHPAALEIDLGTGRRGERDDLVAGLLCELTGAEAACVVNNNAAAVLLVLNTLALGRGTVVSRGELIEIGGSFRMPEIMARAGTRLVEVGATNRTHLRDYEAAIGPDTGLLLKVHTSNYLIQGFTSEVRTDRLAALARNHGVALVDDLGSGTLIDLERFGLRRERTVQDALQDGADLVTFSGDKLLGGPQAGFILGRMDLVRACCANPMKRALRLDKLRLAALEATLKLYRDPDRLAERLPTLRSFTRSVGEIEAACWRLLPPLAAALGERFQVETCACASQIGSGALPLETIESAGLAIRPAARAASGRHLAALAAACRRLPLPVLGRIEKGALVLDLRCLDDEPAFRAQLGELAALLDRPEPPA
jgi:L-seryl-tRNA(Ser) seleniumtransferase